ncbi:MAG: conjugative transposon protein TraJ [Bacteroidetes bacterium]|nr:conjugative transposon protein TraJ [Bacteroidota bacterium]
MKHRSLIAAVMVASATLLPIFSYAQGTAEDMHSLRGILSTLYDQMIPLCSQMINVGRGIAGFAAMWYIAMRVWKHIAAAEPVDFYPLLRPFAIGFCITIFPTVLNTINGVLSPTVAATAAMVGDQNVAMQNILNDEQENITQQGAASLNNGSDKWYGYSHPDNTTTTSPANSSIADQFSGWGFSNMIKRALWRVLNTCYEAAALCIDTIRTFKLIVLAILGPLCFGLSVFDGFQHTLKQWLARYVNVYMWLPVANIFGAILAKIQVNMNLVQQAGGPNVDHTNTVYMIFMLIGIVGYFAVPSIANYIIHVGGHALLSKTTAAAASTATLMTGMNFQSIASANQANSQTNNYSSSSTDNNYSTHMENKIKGNTDTK